MARCPREQVRSARSRKAVILEPAGSFTARTVADFRLFLLTEGFEHVTKIALAASEKKDYLVVRFGAAGQRCEQRNCFPIRLCSLDG